MVFRSVKGHMRAWYFFFFQAEDGIRDSSVTGVQTCALPIWCGSRRSRPHGQPQQERPHPLGESGAFAFQPLEPEIEAPAAAGELPPEPRGVSDLGRCLADAEGELPAAHAR